MTAAAALRDLHLPDGWTTDQLDELPEDGQRYELVDGALIVAPSPTSDHQKTASRVEHTLEVGCPPEWVVLQGVEIRINRRRSFTPDVLVVTAKAAARGPSKFEPHEVLLVIEVVSPGLVTMDRVTKPALYAAAGIPYYWRVETEDGIVVHTHKLEPTPEVYVPTGSFDSVVELDEPWRIRLPISDLTPRFYRAGRDG